jgi:hypothetical protein
MKSYRCEDWSRLGGAEIEVRRHGELVRAGVVDAVMPDAKMLWLASDHNGNRALFESAEGYEIWADAPDLQDESCWSMPAQQQPTMPVPDKDDSPLNTSPNLGDFRR